ncbi:MAG: MEDS domain-containing protein [Myxococcales bacterium]|nr:MEDS domain-containing protein [Myxococcales bacterium]
MARAEISLGFTEQRFPAGAHVCQLFTDDEERQNAVLAFLLSGLRATERVSCFSDKTSEERVAEFLDDHDISYAERKASGAISLAPAGGVYFEDGRFDPDRMLLVLTAFHDDAVRDGYVASRVIGEMSPEIQQMPGGSRLLEYESRVSVLLRTHSVTTVCQYDARGFDGAMILDILKVHPLMVVQGSVVNNPFFITPETYLGL